MLRLSPYANKPDSTRQTSSGTISCFSEQSEIFSLFLQQGKRLSVTNGKTLFSDQKEASFRGHRGNIVDGSHRTSMLSLLLRRQGKHPSGTSSEQSETFSLFLQQGKRHSVTKGKTWFSVQPCRGTSLIIKGIAPGRPLTSRRCSTCPCDAKAHVRTGCIEPEKA